MNGKLIWVMILLGCLSVSSLYSQTAADSLLSSFADSLLAEPKPKTRNVIGFVPARAEVVNGWAIGWLCLDCYRALGDYEFDRDTIRVNGLYTNISPAPLLLIAYAVPFVLVGAVTSIFHPPPRIKNIPMNDSTQVESYDGAFFNGPTDGILGRHKMNGVSIGTFEIADGFSIQGLQVSAIGHSADKLKGVSLATAGAEFAQFKGMMISGIVNITDSGTGGQIALVNLSGKLKGVQIGLVNRIEEESRGLQIGLFNMAKKMKGIQIGLWNKIGKRRLPFINMSF